MGLKFERRRLQMPEVEHLGTYSLYWEPEKLSIAKIVCHIWYSPVLLLLFVADLLRLFISTGVGSVSDRPYYSEILWEAISMKYATETALSQDYGTKTLSWESSISMSMFHQCACMHVCRVGRGGNGQG